MFRTHRAEARFLVDCSHIGLFRTSFEELSSAVYQADDEHAGHCTQDDDQGEFQAGIGLVLLQACRSTIDDRFAKVTGGCQTAVALVFNARATVSAGLVRVETAFL